MNRRFWISTVVIVGLVGWLVVYLGSNVDQFSDIRKVTPGAVALLLILTGLYLHSQGLILRDCLASVGISLSPRQWFGTIVLTFLGNYLLPFSGIGFRFTYLKRAHGFSYGDFISTSIAIVLIELLVFSLGGVAAVLYLFFQNGVMEPILCYPLVGLSLLLFFFLVFDVPLPRWEGRLMNKVREVVEKWHGVRRNRALVWRLTLWTLYCFVANAALFWVAFWALGYRLPVMSAPLVACLSDFSLFFRIAPAALGTYDAAIVYSVGLFGLSVGQGLLVVALVRSALLVWIFVAGPVFSALLLGGGVRRYLKAAPPQVHA